MATKCAQNAFSEAYVRFRDLQPCARETADRVPEHVVQCVWYDQLFPNESLRTAEGHRIDVLSPGWWNHQEGPDFRGAQIAFNGKLYSGDVEIHLNHSGWNAHGHHLDARYDDVILHVVLEPNPAPGLILTSAGRHIPTLFLGEYLREGIHALADVVIRDDYPHATASTHGSCADQVARHGVGGLSAFLHLAGEWRMLNKARALRQRMDQAGREQAVYEALLYACGFSHFKHHFRTIARHLPYDRARQLSLQEPLLLEAALFQIGGLLPKALPPGTTAVPHFARLRALRRDRLAGLRSLPLTWHRIGVRPNNNPERRLAGAARLIARTARAGLLDSLDGIWRKDRSPLQCRREFEALFPNPLGFWAAHCTWTGKKLTRPAALLGPGRVRSIIGNVFVPAGLALARADRDRLKEEKVFDFFLSLPKEPDNQIVKVMLPRVVGASPGLKLDFRTQQGLLQMHQDWCEPNPSCHNCALLRHLDFRGLISPRGHA